MLAPLGRLDRPRHVQMVRQRIVDGVDVLVGEQLLVRSVRLRNAQFRRRSLRLLEISRRDGRDFRPLATLHGRDDLVGRDLGHAEHAPTNLAHCWRFYADPRVAVTGADGLRPFQSIQEPLTAEGAESAEQIGKNPNVSAVFASSAVKSLLSSEETELTGLPRRLVRTQTLPIDSRASHHRALRAQSKLENTPMSRRSLRPRR